MTTEKRVEAKWIIFELVETQKKFRVTLEYTIKTKEIDPRNAKTLGYIYFHAPWRKYCFFPKDGTLYETKCLQDIINFINHLMQNRKHELQQRKQQRTETAGQPQ